MAKLCKQTSRPKMEIKVKEFIIGRIHDSIAVKKSLLENGQIIEMEEKVAKTIIECLKKGGKLVLCGNGGSASDALHFAGEIVGRFQKERKAWPAVVLNADVATLTAIANDYGYEDAFARQAEGHVTERDILIGISTSGNSENVYRAVLAAKKAGAKTAALLGADGGKIGKACDYPIVVPSTVAARVQEAHILLIHILCELAEDELAGREKT